MSKLRICGLFFLVSFLVLSVGASASNQQGATTSATLPTAKGDAAWVQLAELVAGGWGDSFGSAVAISGDTVAVGSPQGAWNNGRLGKAYVFVKPTTGWVDMGPTATLTTVNPTFTWLGTSVDTTGDIVVAGGPMTGSAYVFVKPPGGWTDTKETARLTTSNGDPLGLAVSIDGDTIVAGAPDSNGHQGAVYVFVKPLTGWADMTETAKLTALDGGKSYNLGLAVALRGKTVVAYGGGSAYVFVRPKRGWKDMAETARLTASNGDSLGAVSIRNDTVVAGAPGATVGSNPGQGAIYVFVRPATGWASTTETAKLTARDGASGDAFGASVFFGGYRIVVGAPGADVGSNVDQGEVYVFAKPTTGWKTTSQFKAKLTATNGGPGDGLGCVSISNGVVAAGSPNIRGQYNGAVWVFAKQ